MFKKAEHAGRRYSCNFQRMQRRDEPFAEHAQAVRRGSERNRTALRSEYTSRRAAYHDVRQLHGDRAHPGKTQVLSGRGGPAAVGR